LPALAYETVTKYVMSCEIDTIVSAYEYKFVRDSYRGGITQVFSYRNFLAADNVCYIDANSLYPAMMAQHTYGLRYGGSRLADCWRPWHQGTVIQEHDLCEITFSLPARMRYGWFPVQTKLGDLIYPLNGRTRAWGFELAAIAKLAPGCVTVVSFLACQRTGTPFERMREIYEMRRAEKDPCLKMLLKLLMNSCYG